MNDRRILSDDFVESLTGGMLSPILDFVRKDSTLDIEIRNKYINIYYRGGNLIKITEIKQGVLYEFKFDIKYSKATNLHTYDELRKKNIVFVSSPEGVCTWVNAIPKIKHAIDFFLGSSKEKNEREFQQLIVRENNYSKIANSTDYFILDIEYTNSDSREARFDMIAMKWPSTSATRKLSNGFLPTLAFIEVKYGDDALVGKSDIKSHIRHMEKFLEDRIKFESLKAEMVEVFKMKRRLKLIKFGKKGGNNHEISSFSGDVKPEYILLLINHDPACSKLNNAKLKPMKNAELKFAVSTFMGYGLYNESIFSLDEFKERFKKQFCSNIN